jgi:drug/metabolite transporter (DMT)-like permease
VSTEAPSRQTATAEAARPELALVLGSLAVVAWGFGPIIVRGISAPVPTIALYRLGFAVPVMWALAYASGGRFSWQLMRSSVLPGVLFGASMITSFESFHRTSIANATLITALVPALVLAVAGPLFGEKVSRRQLGLSVCSFLGIVLVVFAAGDSSGASLDGDLLAVATLVIFTGYFLVVKQRRDGGVQSWSFIAAIITVATLMTLPWALAASDDLTAINGRDWLLIALMILGPGVVGHGFMTWSQRHLDVSLSSLLTLGAPVISALAAWVIYDQSLLPLQVLGAAIVLGSLAGVVVSARRPAARAAPAPAIQGADAVA